MTQQGWSYGQVCRFVAANYPCEMSTDAPWLVMKWIEGGTLPARDASGLAVAASEWRRDEAGRLEIAEDVTPHSMTFDPAIVRRLCAPDQPKNAGGRPVKYDYEGGLIYLAKLVFNDPSYSRPTEEVLFKALQEWMRRTPSIEGNLPDDREISKRATRFFHEVIGEELD